ncbi:hypothetical protein BJP36_36065 [Moorena producens JHB]|uniref:Uncharacterized protein n=1 Tax=Moorena producens (strain JHB) TaxID=1454205 RepID=A0A9Q9UW59_MOOP1|nr:hypothetical protein [Moorena producens]WAN69511.1 hypothetical protein BJP36_36065 [Moorena producens JHB]
MKEKIKILDLETRPSQETDLQELSVDDLNGVVGAASGLCGRCRAVSCAGCAAVAMS